MALLWISTKPMAGHDLVALHFSSQDKEQVQAFRRTCLLHLNRDTDWFLQCDENTYIKFEFWTFNQDAVLVTCMDVAERMGMDLPIDPEPDEIRSAMARA